MSQVSLYYDGLCRVCSAEINHYKGMRGSEKIEFIDITRPEFDAAKEHLDPQKIHEEIHARDAFGKMHVGVDAFILIWSKLSALQWLSKLAERSSVNAILRFAYKGFVRVRPFLPRKKCEDSPYCSIESKT